ncbi:thioredoxin-like protein [Pyronema domesticum]|uniref:Large ribosomal subunit protein mL43 n=1 Tax=Pyronema omphalodes (strain CBS 100304) TaxID=1076935 RepID=U4LR85_PYROM|nr:thioredoxin-like protein [Pyronema domesticum]CCX34701.1 Similar to 54S ribosomal protein L51, mitochondrial; acc. no. Q9UUC8 [Pyronema omphalodes CBS 100304]
MPVNAIRLVSKSQNGVGAFVLQCKRLEFNYCDWAGSSKGMNSFLKNVLPKFAKENPQIEITVAPRPHRHPIIRGEYINGREKVICVANLEHNQILQKADLLRNSSGLKLKRFNKPVKSENQSVRGIYSPFHGANWQI